jgi:sialidase-1
MLGTWNNRGTPHAKMLNGSLDRVRIGYSHRLITTSTPFESGTGYNTYRIPALVRTGEGTLLAVCEGRATVSDDGDINLVLRRSTDNGATWLAQQVLAGDSDTNNWRDPTLIVDGARIHLICCWRHGNDSEAEIKAGTGVDTQRVYHLYSDDDGVTWTSPNEITTSVKGATERYISTGPGHGIKLAQGVYAGRLVVVGNVTDPDTFGDSLARSMCFYSDDNGVTWQRGGTVATANGTEAQVFEVADGTLVMNIRDQGTSNRRIVAASADGGSTWSAAAQDTVLVDPKVQGSIYRFSDSKIVFANPALSTSRDNMVLRIGAYDVNKSGEVNWQQSIPIYRGKSAYSDLCAIGTDVGLLFEKGSTSQYEAIEFRRYAVCA